MSNSRTVSSPPFKGRDSDGRALYDHSEDEARAAAGDDAAAARLRTKARLLAGQFGQNKALPE